MREETIQKIDGISFNDCPHETIGNAKQIAGHA